QDILNDGFGNAVTAGSAVRQKLAVAGSEDSGLRSCSDRIKWRVRSNEFWSHAQADAALPDASPADQSNHAAHSLPFPNQGLGLRAYAMPVHFLERPRGAHQSSSQYQYLAGRVPSIEVKGRVRLGDAVLLCELQGFAESGAAMLHLGEDVVGSAIQNASDLGHLTTRANFGRDGDARSPGEREACSGCQGGLSQLVESAHQRPFVYGNDVRTLR